jgi:hypothetical protein
VKDSLCVCERERIGWLYLEFGSVGGWGLRNENICIYIYIILYIWVDGCGGKCV